MKKYLTIWWRIQAGHLGKDLNSGWNLLVRILGSLCFFVLHLVSLQFLLRKFIFSGWNNSQIWTLLLVFEMFTYLAFLFFWRGLVFSLRAINRGDFDYLLTKPINARFLTFLRGGGIQNLICSLLAFLFLILNNKFIFWNWPVFLFVLFISLWMLFCIATILISLNFILGYIPGTDSIIFEVQEAYKYPASTYDKFSLWIQVLIVPFAALTTIPTLVLLNKPIAPSTLIIYITSGIFLTIFSQWLWKKALLNYTSASS